MIQSGVCNLFGMLNGSWGQRPFVLIIVVVILTLNLLFLAGCNFISSYYFGSYFTMVWKPFTQVWGPSLVIWLRLFLPSGSCVNFSFRVALTPISLCQPCFTGDNRGGLRRCDAPTSSSPAASPSSLSGSLLLPGAKKQHVNNHCERTRALEASWADNI